MKLQKPVLVGGTLAFLAWLFFRDPDDAQASDEEKVRLVEIANDEAGTIASTVAGGTGVELVDVGFTIHDEETGECVGASDAFGNTISCLEHDKRLMDAQQPGGIMVDANG